MWNGTEGLGGAYEEENNVIHVIWAISMCSIRVFFYLIHDYKYNRH